MPFYNELQQATRSGQEYLLTAPIIQQVFDGHFTIETYMAFLHQAFHHVKHTVPLLMASGARLGDDHEWARKTIHGYIEEEYGHEAWILDDLVACGCDRETWATSAAPYHSEIMVSFLYDYVQRKNPMGIFGMVLVLEGTSSSLAPEVARLVQQKLGLPDAAMTYLTTHGELDQDHIGYFERAMDRVTSAEDQSAIIHVANTVYRLYGDVYRSLPAAAEALKAGKAA